MEDSWEVCPYCQHGAFPDFDGKYTDVEWLGERELACTFRAVSPRLRQQVFLKMLREGKQDDHTAVRLFLNEIAILQWLARDVPEVPALSVLETGTWRQRPYFAQRLLRGWALNEALSKYPVLNGASALGVIEGCLRFLELLHAAGVVHGDVSPDNIFIETTAPVAVNGCLPEMFHIRVVDFNSARRFERPEARTEKLLLKPPYAAPEVTQGQPLSPLTDLYAVGIVFFELLAGQRPYDWETLRDLQNLRDHSVPYFPLILQVPDLIEDFMRSLLAPDPAKRPRSASECLRRLREFNDLHQWLRRETTVDVSLIPRLETPRQGPATLGFSRTGLATAISSSPTPTLATAGPIPLARQIGTSRRSITATGPAPAGTDLKSAVYDVRVPREEEQEFHLANFSVFAPKTIAPATSFVLEVWTYVAAHREEMLARAARHDRLIERGSRGPVYVPSGTELTLLLRLDRFGLREAQDSFYWAGELANVPFIVDAPGDLAAGNYPGQVNILHCGMLLARLVFEVQVGRTQEEAAPLTLQRQEIKKAFASYAATDRDEVLRRVQGITAAGIDVFLDAVSLRAGDDWEQELVRNIVERDIFYLFWSVAARRSHWVDKEWRLALKERGLDCIHPIPLVDPSIAPPPTELASRHFNDLLLACMRSQAISLGDQ